MNSLIHSDWWPLQEEEMGAQTHTETFSLDTERRWPPAGNQYNCTPRLGVQALELWENQFCCSNPIVSGLDCPNKLKSFVYLTSYLRLMSPKTNLKFKCPAPYCWNYTSTQWDSTKHELEWGFQHTHLGIHSKFNMQPRIWTLALPGHSDYGAVMNNKAAKLRIGCPKGSLQNVDWISFTVKTSLDKASPVICEICLEIV